MLGSAGSHQYLQKDYQSRAKCGRLQATRTEYRFLFGKIVGKGGGVLKVGVKKMVSIKPVIF